MGFLDHNPNDIWKFRTKVMGKVNIVEIAKEYGMHLEIRESGEFTHRSYCPFHKNSNGDTERTPSFFISGKTNSFFCFGCSSQGSLIDFICLMDGTPPMIALTKLAKRIGLINKDGKWDELTFDAHPEIVTSQKTIESSLFEISYMLRDYIRQFINSDNFEKEFKWIEKIEAKIDTYLMNIEYGDWEFAKKLCDKVSLVIENKKKRFYEDCDIR